MAEFRKVPLFIADVGAIADDDIDEWATRMADYVSRVTGMPYEEDGPATDAESPSDNRQVS